MRVLLVRTAQRVDHVGTRVSRRTEQRRRFGPDVVLGVLEEHPHRERSRIVLGGPALALLAAVARERVHRPTPNTRVVMGEVCEEVGNRQRIEVMVEHDATPLTNAGIRTRKAPLERFSRVWSAAHEFAECRLDAMLHAEIRDQLLM